MKARHTTKTFTIVSVLLGLGAHAGLAALPGQPATATSRIQLDASAVRHKPRAEIPAAPLVQAAFSDEMIVRNLLRVEEQFNIVDAVGAREMLESSDWRIERDWLNGSLLALRKSADAQPSPQEPAELAGDAMIRLQGWGIPGEEVLSVLPRMLKRQDEDDRGASEPKLHRYKTFVFRGINGIPIEGHRAVVTHHLDGSLHRVLVKWPPLALTGHRLQSPLSEQGIVQRAAAALAREGVSDGQAKLRWKYVPTQLESGEVALELVVGARVAAKQSGNITEEPREINISVDARE